MTTPNIADTLAKLTAQQAALGDGRDCRSDNERADWFARYRMHQEVISGLMNAPDDLAREQTKLDDLDERRVATTAKIAEVERQIADAPDHRLIDDGRQRDKEYDRQRDLRRQLEHLHAGTLLCAPGRCYERLDDLERRIAEVRDRRDRAQLQLDALVRRAEALLAAASVTST